MSELIKQLICAHKWMSICDIWITVDNTTFKCEKCDKVQDLYGRTYNER